MTGAIPMGDEMRIDRELVQVVFDTAINSMDFGSGFLDEAEVLALRGVAAALGVDPAVATPRQFACKMVHGGQHELRNLPRSTYCSRCGTYAERPASPDGGKADG
jgi:hypothetical protein